MYNKLESHEIKKYGRQLIELPPMADMASKITYALDEGHFPVEYFVQTNTVDYQDLLNLDLRDELKEKLFNCMKEFGMIESGKDLSEVLSGVEQEQKENRMNKVAEDLNISETPEKKISRLETQITNLMVAKNELAEQLKDSESKLLKTQGDLEFVKNKYKDLSETNKSLKEQLDNVGGDAKSSDNLVTEMRNKLEATKELLNDKEAEINRLKDSVESLNSKVDLSNELKEAAIQAEREKYEAIIESYKNELRGGVGVGSSDTGSVDKYKEVSRTRLEGYKIIGIYGNTRTFIKSLIRETGEFKVLDEPVECDLAVVVGVPSFESINRLRENITKYGGNRVVKVVNLWGDNLSFDYDTLLDTELDLVINYDSRIYEKSLLNDIKDLSALIDNDVIVKINDLINKRLNV